jgi:hypothetical protein
VVCAKRFLVKFTIIAAMLASHNAMADNRLGATPTVSKERAIAPQAALGNIFPSIVFANASFSTGGVGLRNRLIASIDTPGGSPATVRAAYLYWAVITNGPVPVAARSPKIARRSPPTVAATSLTATQVGFGPSPCWGGTGITVYRASVPLTVAKGGGTYEISFPAGASGTTTNLNPWLAGSQFPMLEGASLVLIFNGENTVAVYDSGLAGKTIAGDTLSYTLSLPRAYTAFLRYDNIGADGQIGFGRQPTADTSKEDTFLGATKIAGPGSIYNDSLWNGGVSGPLPQLWDNTSIDLTGNLLSGTVGMALSHFAASDCVTPVANIIAVR